MKYIIALLVFVSINYCQNNIKNSKIYEIGEVIWNYKYKTNSQYYRVRNAVSYKDSLIIFTEKYSKCIYKHDIKTGNTIQIGRSGSGPGEYRYPNHLYINGKIIYYEDNDMNRIQGIDFDGKYITNVKLKTGLELYNAFILYNDKAYIVRNTINKYWLVDSNGKLFVPQNIVFSSRQNPNLGGDIFEENDLLYFINCMEFVVYKYDIKNDKLESLKINGLENILDWKPYYNKKMSYKEYNEIVTERMICVPLKIINMTHNNKLYFGISYLNKKRNSIYYAIINPRGICVANINMGNFRPYSFGNGVLKCIEYNDKADITLGFSNFKLNNETLNLLK